MRNETQDVRHRQQRNPIHLIYLFYLLQGRKNSISLCYTNDLRVIDDQSDQSPQGLTPFFLKDRRISNS